MTVLAPHSTSAACTDPFTSCLLAKIRRIASDRSDSWLCQTHTHEKKRVSNCGKIKLQEFHIHDGYLHSVGWLVGWLIDCGVLVEQGDFSDITFVPLAWPKVPSLQYQTDPHLYCQQQKLWHPYLGSSSASRVGCSSDHRGPTLGTLYFYIAKFQR